MIPELRVAPGARFPKGGAALRLPVVNRKPERRALRHWRHAGPRHPGPFATGMGRDPGTIRSCQRRLARLAPMDARAGPTAGPARVPGLEVDPALGGAASCESRAHWQTVPSAPPRHGRVRVPIASGTSESAVTVTRPRQITTAVAVAGTGDGLSGPGASGPQPGLSGTLGSLAGHSGHRQLEPARDFGRRASPLVYAAPNLTLIDYYSREPHG